MEKEKESWTTGNRKPKTEVRRPKKRMRKRALRRGEKKKAALAVKYL